MSSSNQIEDNAQQHEGTTRMMEGSTGVETSIQSTVHESHSSMQDANVTGVTAQASERSDDLQPKDQPGASPQNTDHETAPAELENTKDAAEQINRTVAGQNEPNETTVASGNIGEEPQPELSEQTAQLSLGEQQSAEGVKSLAIPSGEHKDGVRSPSPPPLPPKDEKFSRGKAIDKDTEKSGTEDVFDEKHPPDESIADTAPEAKDEDDRSEIQSIMGQFGEGVGPGVEEIMSPRLEKAQPVMFPPRSSSLDPMQPGILDSPGSAMQRTMSRESHSFNTSAVRPMASSSKLSLDTEDTNQRSSARPKSIISPSPSNASMFQPPPPSPDPEPALPFDFHRFLEQLRHRTADPVARFLRSFLMEFGKKQWMVHEQVKIISDFLEFISKKMAQCEVWRTVSDAEFDNAREGMEKLVMNRLYSQTFSPAIPPVEQTPTSRTKSNKSHPPQDPHGPGRRGQHQEDVERDDVIAQKLRIYGWIKEEHLDIPSSGEKGRKFLALAQQELLKINSYRAPRDKVICVLNCCKVIFGYLKNNKSDQSADAFVPLLIYTVLKGNPDHLVSNVQYILRFRNQDKLGGEAGYYISSLMGVVSFVENLDRTNLTITDEEFERNVEASVSVIAEGHKAESYESKIHSPNPSTAQSPPSNPAYLSEKSAPSRPEVTKRNSADVSINRSSTSTSSSAAPSRRTSTRIPSSSDPQPDGTGTVATGLIRTIRKPLSSIGRIFSDENTTTQTTSQTPPLTPGFPSPALEPQSADDETRPPRPQRTRSRREEDSAARQASTENAEAQRIREKEHRIVVETLEGMFPDLDKDVISDVVRMKEGRVGLAVDACLALSN